VELRDREERLRAIVNTVLDGIITIDDKGMIEDLNPAAARAFGCNQA
jgi:PAS domain S-box-containing protein